MVLSLLKNTLINKFSWYIMCVVAEKTLSKEKTEVYNEKTGI